MTKAGIVHAKYLGSKIAHSIDRGVTYEDKCCAEVSHLFDITLGWYFNKLYRGCKSQETEALNCETYVQICSIKSNAANNSEYILVRRA